MVASWDSLASSPQPIIGTKKTHRYSDSVQSFVTEDVLIFYTDGLTEAQGPQGKTFNRPFLRLMKSIDHRRPLSAMRDQLVATLADFQGSPDATDDLCIILVRPTHSSVRKASA